MMPHYSRLVRIPLRGDDVIEFDFGAAYQNTFEGGFCTVMIWVRKLAHEF